MSDTRLCPLRLSYVQLRVKNLDESLRLWTQAVPLEISARQAGAREARGDALKKVSPTTVFCLS